MRYILDIDAADTQTHIVAFDSIVEHAYYALQAWDRPDAPPDPDLFFYRTRIDPFDPEEKRPLPATPANRAWWLGRDDLKGWADIPDAVTQPWTPGLSAVERMRARLEEKELPAPRSIRRRQEWRDDCGGSFDLDRHLSGQPAFRVPVNRHVVARQFVTLLVESAAPREVGADNLHWRGAAAVVLAERLEAAGYAVEIVVYSAGRAVYRPAPTRGFPGEQNTLVVTWLKRFDDPIDTGAIVAATAPWFSRVLGFAVYPLLKAGPLCPHYGYLHELDKSLLEYFTHNEDTRTLEGVWSERAAYHAVRRILDGFAAGTQGEDEE